MHRTAGAPRGITLPMESEREPVTREGLTLAACARQEIADPSLREQIAIEALNLIKQEVGPDNVELSVGYVGLIGSSYPINTIFLWMRGPEEAVLRVALTRGIST